MSMKVAVVTGGGNGIGRECAMELARRNTAVVIADIDQSSAKSVSEEINACGGSSAYVRCDAASEADVRAMVECAQTEFGGLDYGINNAGVIGPSGVPVEDLSLDQWANAISVNLTGVMLAMKYEIPALRERGGGAIVNMSSAAGLVATPFNPTYCASKHGVLGLTKATACAYAKEGIRINAVCPGPVETELLGDMQKLRGVSSADVVSPVPLGRTASASEIAECVVWLCSDASSYVVGHALSVDGGWTAH